MRNTLVKDIEKQIASLEGIIDKHKVELNAEYLTPLSKALEALHKAKDDSALYYLNKCREYMGEARIEAIVDEVVDGYASRR